MTETPAPERVPEDIDNDWVPDGYEPPEYDDPGDFPEPDHQMADQEGEQ